MQKKRRYYGLQKKTCLLGLLRLQLGLLGVAHRVGQSLGALGDLLEGSGQGVERGRVETLRILPPVLQLRNQRA